MTYWIACLAALATPATAQEQKATTPFVLAPLPYPATALEPVIDAETMTLHHDRHHQAYIDSLNKAIAADPALAGRSLEQLLAVAGAEPAAVRNNAGGHWNHSFFWKTMARPGTGGQPSPELARAIDAAFGSMDAMKAAFKTAGTGRFGSGWVWLILGPDSRLAIASTPNQDNPLMDVAETHGTPLLGNDVWEHAYYLKHRNRRADYLDAWWQVVDWKTVSERFAAARR
ncbi:superoxide dismutase [Sphingomonas sanguinis]|uniref:superoxide dismutase n=1 Tax=Sphingomonas sp. LC-1 TaxID=3110957 RepID=UPI0021BB3811|nr:superoxide dismutase [Sphingomonas sp. LC-1]MCT8002232.1 superoxide dismutase [Sphingomonas sp. LC-1]